MSKSSSKEKRKELLREFAKTHTDLVFQAIFRMAKKHKEATSKSK